MGSVTTKVPHGYRLMPTVIDEFAVESPEKVFASIPKSTKLEEGYYDITYADLSRAINRAAAFLEKTFGKSTTFETLSYLGPFDLRYFIIPFAASKIGYKVLLPSLRNSLEGQLNLFRSTDCKALLTSSGYNISPQLISESKLTPIIVPSLATLLAEGEVTHYPFIKTYDEAKDDPFMVLHTSGSTGLPKPIVLKHAWSSSLDAYNTFGELDGYSSLWWEFKNRRVFLGLPPFHAAGIVAGLMCPLWFNSVTVWQPPDRPLSTVLVDEVLDVSDADFIYAPPSILEDLAQFPDSLRKLERLAVVAYGGGPLNPKVGDLLCKRTTIVNTTGSTEMGTLPFWNKASEDWAYFHFNPAHEGIQFIPAGDGAYEQIFTRHPSSDKFHSGWSTFPHLDKYSMNDLYTPHPTKPNLWLYAGRADDVIVLSNGEKLNPSTMETTLCLHPNVKGALVVGQARFAPAAVIELQKDIGEKLDTPERKAAYLENEVWPYAVKANEAAEAHAQLSLDRIILSQDDKPFARAAKGTVQRGVTVKLYSKEIDEIYTRSEEGQDFANLSKIDVHRDIGELEAQLGALIKGMLGITLESEQDFFVSGMDSLHVMTLVRLLKNVLVGIPVDNINSRLVYSHPTLPSLAVALQTGVSGTFEFQAESREEEMLKVLNHFTAQLPILQASASQLQVSDQLEIILTGSTGSLGSYLLHTLLSSPRVSKVYCLNRTANSEERQVKGNRERSLISTWGHRIEFLHTDLSKPFLGLAESTYSSLTNEVSIIIHNQWPVDFNLSLTSFLPHIQGVSNLISLSSTSPLKPPIYFTSTIGTLGNYSSLHPSSTLVPEIALTDPKVPLHQGYSESKWISENLLSAACQRSGVSSAILRIGQIAGPVDIEGGSWNQNEWFPNLVRSCGFLGVVPETLPGQDDVRWVPVDRVAGVVWDLVLAGLNTEKEEGSWTRYFHVCNPKEGKWSELVSVVKDHLEKKLGKEVKIVGFGEWVEKLEASAEKGEVEGNPAVKLLEFYRGMWDGERKAVDMDTKETQKKSGVLRELEVVGVEWMKLWLEQWGF